MKIKWFSQAPKHVSTKLFNEDIDNTTLQKPHTKKNTTIEKEINEISESERQSKDKKKSEMVCNCVIVTLLCKSIAVTGYQT